jgi:hypothetical protein
MIWIGKNAEMAKQSKNAHSHGTMPFQFPILAILAIVAINFRFRTS